MPEIILDPDHKYYVDYQQVPGFSEIIKDLGIGGNPFWTEEGRDEGTALHKWCIFLASGNEPAEPPDPRIAGRIDGFRKFLQDSQFIFEDGEKPLYHNDLKYCVMPDLWGWINTMKCVIEIKRGAKMSHHRLQTAAQALALIKNGFWVVDRYALYLSDGDYRLVPHIGRLDQEYWKTLVAAYHVKKLYQGEK